jgi:glutamine synthetase
MPASPASLVERHGLGAPGRAEAVKSVEEQIRENDIQIVRLSFVDQHGLLRGKTLVAAEIARAMDNGVGAPSSLLLKDTSNRTVFAAFTPQGGVGIKEMEGAGDMLMIPDPATFRILPWAAQTGWMLCDLRFGNGAAVAFSTRDLYRTVLARLESRGLSFMAGAELEFHLFQLTDKQLRPEDAAQPGKPPDVELTTQGYQYLGEYSFDELDPIYQKIRVGLQGLALPLCSLEVEFGPSQCEITFNPGIGLEAADIVILARSAIKQIARREGYHATFMCRPRIANVVSSGWHLHQSLRNVADGANAFATDEPEEILSPLGRAYLAGLLDHANAAASFSTPTINGYKRYRPYSLAPDRAIWGRDNRGAMLRVVGEPGSAATRIENRVGEPAANPYLYMASQIVSGFDGIDRGLAPPPSADSPYETPARALPRSLDEALAALDGDACLRAGFGDPFVDYWLHLKRAELVRFNAEVSEWEQREYFSIF